MKNGGVNSDGPLSGLAVYFKEEVEKASRGVPLEEIYPGDYEEEVEKVGMGAPSKEIYPGDYEEEVDESSFKKRSSELKNFSSLSLNGKRLVENLISGNDECNVSYSIREDEDRYSVGALYDFGGAEGNQIKRTFEVSKRIDVLKKLKEVISYEPGFSKDAFELLGWERGGGRSYVFKIGKGGKFGFNNLTLSDIINEDSENKLRQNEHVKITNEDVPILNDEDVKNQVYNELNDNQKKYLDFFVRVHNHSTYHLTRGEIAGFEQKKRIYEAFEMLGRPEGELRDMSNVRLVKVFIKEREKSEEIFRTEYKPRLDKLRDELIAQERYEAPKREE